MMPRYLVSAVSPHQTPPSVVSFVRRGQVSHSDKRSFNFFDLGGRLLIGGSSALLWAVWHRHMSWTWRIEVMWKECSKFVWTVRREEGRWRTWRKEGRQMANFRNSWPHRDVKQLDWDFELPQQDHRRPSKAPGWQTFSEHVFGN